MKTSRRMRSFRKPDTVNTRCLYFSTSLVDEAPSISRVSFDKNAGKRNSVGKFLSLGLNSRRYKMQASGLPLEWLEQLNDHKTAFVKTSRPAGSSLFFTLCLSRFLSNCHNIMSTYWRACHAELGCRPRCAC